MSLTLFLSQRTLSVPDEGGMRVFTDRLRTDERGSVTVEYVVLLVLIALGCGLAIAGLGVPLMRMFLVRQTWLLLPLP